ncbi:MAG: putative nucleic acid-binding Zn-ribbon protein [Haloarculaceae archaeon]|jgi:predicted  nucleic acid-binding Zn-ribbon protein
MPHQCTDCGRSFDDGSTEMLSGCPDCGGTTFQYKPDGATDPDPDTAEDPPEPPEPPVDSSVARTVGNAATAVRDFVGSSSPSAKAQGPDGPVETTDPDQTPTTASARTDPDEPVSEPEDTAQASARSEVVSPDDLPPPPETAAGTTDRSSPPGADAESPDGTADDQSQERPDLKTLREELNDQFESIKVVAPGHYELNLMELYDREEYIIALQEDGKYTIQVPDGWNDA